MEWPSLAQTLTYMQEVRSAGEAEVLDNPVPDVLHQGAVDSEGEPEDEGEGEGGLGGSHVSLSGGPSLLDLADHTGSIYRDRAQVSQGGLSSP